MTKIINWVCGSFFRTIGRVIAFLVIGCLVAVIIDKSDIKITDLFNLQVNASTMYGSNFISNLQIKEGNSYTNMTYTNDGMYDYELTNQSGQKAYVIKFDRINLSSSTKEVKLTLKYLPNYTLNQSYQLYKSNSDFSCIPSYLEEDEVMGINDANGQRIMWYWDRDFKITQLDCTYLDMSSAITGGSSSSNFDYSLTVNYTYNNNEWLYSPCYATGQSGSNVTFTCPIVTDNIDGFRIGVQSTKSHNATIGLSPLLTYELDGTTAIIDNQNANTNATIENQNQNTQQQIESQQICTQIDKNDIKESGYLNSGGGIVETDIFGITDYINVFNANVKVTTQASYGIYACYYNVNKTLISCEREQDKTALTLPNNTYYAKFSINKNNNSPQFEVCQNGNQALSNTINDTNVSESESEASSFFSSFTIQDHGGLSAIVTAPLQTISNLLSNTCTDLVLLLPYVNENITLPCLSDIYSEHFGAFFTIYQALILALVSYRCLRSLFFDVRGFIDPNDGRIEVLDL